MKDHKKIYAAILNYVDKNSAERREIISWVSEKIESGSPLPLGEIRAKVGSVLTEMLDNGILVDNGGVYALASSKPVCLRVECCEKEMLSLLREREMSKQELRSALVKRFGTDKTTSTRDDSILYSLIGQVTKRLTSFGVIEISEGKYRIAPEKAAKIDNIESIIALKSEFITRLHSKGGEFFEHFIVTLLSKHLASTGKVIKEAYVTGGEVDGGVDGIIKTVDTLGFSEVIMIQAKNRIEVTNETTVRGFYGAVCAMQGTRGIFATTSDFHESAKQFLDGIDNCVGINADRIFALAVECKYGIVKHKNSYQIDTKIL